MEVWINGKFEGTAYETSLDFYSEEIHSFDSNDFERISGRTLSIWTKKPPGEVKRPDWDTYFLNIARAVSLRGDCSRRQVGAVVVDSEHRIVATGYNGVAPGIRGCISQPCPRVSAETPCQGYSDCRSIHAETNALLYAGADKCLGASLYITDEPCSSCMKLIQAMQIFRVVWPGGQLYPSSWTLPASEPAEEDQEDDDDVLSCQECGCRGCW